jgi:hypothetical protein
VVRFYYFFTKTYSLFILVYLTTTVNTIVFKHPAALVNYLYITIQPSVQLHKSLVEPQLSPCFRVNSVGRFEHAEPSSAICIAIRWRLEHR